MTAQATVALPEKLADYSWRPITNADLPAVHALVVACDRADDTSSAGTLADFVREFEDPQSIPEHDTRLVMAPDGEVVAMARLFVNPNPATRPPRVAYLWGEVHPAHRGRGLGTFVLGWMEMRSRERLAALQTELNEDLPCEIRLGTGDKLQDRIDLYTAHGFAPLRYFYRMRRDLAQPVPPAVLPDGLTLRTFTPDLSEALRDAFNNSFDDHWGFEPVDAEDWRVFFMERSSLRPDLTFLVMDGERIAAYSINQVKADDNARQGFSEGWIGQLGTRRPYRKRGLASTLICRSMQAFKEEGLQFATLGVDSENPTGAMAIYQRLGFENVKRFINFNKTI